MLIRYHWGLGVGHKYSWEGSHIDTFHHQQPAHSTPSAMSPQDDMTGHHELEAPTENTSSIGVLGFNNNATNLASDLPSDEEPEPEEMNFSGLEDLENEDLGDDDSDSG